MDAAREIGCTNTPDQIGRNLFQMNEDALKARYSDASDMVDKHHQEYTWVKPLSYTSRNKTGDKPADKDAYYSATCCLLYQCSEGAIPERPLFRALQDAERAFRLLGCDLEENPKGIPWDFPELPRLVSA